MISGIRKVIQHSAQYSYLPFGEKLSSTGSTGNLFTFSGASGVLDLGDGLYQMAHRTYSPSLGRFIQPDPLGFAGGDTNLYRYVDNNPVVGTDPSGLIGDEVELREAAEALKAAEVLAEAATDALLSTELGSQAISGVAAAVDVAADAGTGEILGLAEDFGIRNGISPLANADLINVSQELCYGANESASLGVNPLADIASEGASNVIKNYTNWIIGASAVIILPFIPIRALQPPAHGETLKPMWPQNPLPWWYGGNKYIKITVGANGRLVYHITLRKVLDPNEIVGPAGGGANQYVTANQPLSYTVFFENEPTAPGTT